MFLLNNSRKDPSGPIAPGYTICGDEEQGCGDGRANFKRWFMDSATPRLNKKETGEGRGRPRERGVGGSGGVPIHIPMSVIHVRMQRTQDEPHRDRYSGEADGQSWRGEACYE